MNTSSSEAVSSTNEKNFKLQSRPNKMRSQSILFSIVIVLSAFGNTKGSSDVCQLGPEPGPCRAYFKRFYYTDTEEKCKEFIYGGCQGNQNNFETLQDCESACSKHVKKDCPKICTLEFEPVCGSDGKTYANKCNLEVSDCESEKEITIKHIGPCVNAEGISQICLMKPDPGFCMAYFPRFYYNPGTKKCETFIYGGCQGNMNNFETLEECESTCSSPGELPDPCLNMLCQFEGKCENENGAARCQCSKACPYDYTPVCGHDGTEYSNYCLLKLAECQAQKEIKYDDGPCRFH